MKTYLIKIPQDISISAAAFDEVFAQLHEILRGETIAFEIIATAQNIGLCFTAEESTSQVIAGQIYAIAPQSDIIEIGDFTEGMGEDVSAIGIEMGLVKNDLLPLKDYQDF